MDPFALPHALPAALARRSRPLLAAAAHGVTTCLERHFLARTAAAAHRPGFPRSNYWAAAARSVRTTLEGDARATISASAPGLRLHLVGGVVRPAQARALAIPLRGEVAGKRPRELERQTLFVLPSRRMGKAFLARRERSGHLTLLYLLVASARHRADPGVLPTRARLLRAALDPIQDL